MLKYAKTQYEGNVYSDIYLSYILFLVRQPDINRGQGKSTKYISTFNFSCFSMSTYVCERCKRQWGKKCNTVFVPPPRNNGWIDMDAHREAHLKYTVDKKFWYVELGGEEIAQLEYDTRDEVKTKAKEKTK